MSKAALVVVSILALAASACGGSAPAPAASLNPALAGTWSGTTRLTLGSSTFSESSTVTVTVSGQQGTLYPVCFDGTGTITATGSGDTASWSGTMPCPAVALGGCSSVVLTFVSAGANYLSLNDWLGASASGSATGCGVTQAATLTFLGSRAR